MKSHDNGTSQLTGQGVAVNELVVTCVAVGVSWLSAWSEASSRAQPTMTTQHTAHKLIALTH